MSELRGARGTARRCPIERRRTRRRRPHLHPHVPRFVADAPSHLGDRVLPRRPRRRTRARAADLAAPPASTCGPPPRQPPVPTTAGSDAAAHSKACASCGALAHSARDCVERIQRRWPAGFTRRAVRRDERQVLRGDDGGACSRDDASKRDFCAGSEPAAGAHRHARGRGHARGRRRVQGLISDVDLAFHNPKTRSMREHPRPACRRSADAPDAAGDNACTSASTAQPAAAAAARSSFFTSARRRRRPRQRRRRARRAQSRFALALPSVEQPRPPAAPITRSHRRASFFSQPGDAHVEYDRAGAVIVGDKDVRRAPSSVCPAQDGSICRSGMASDRRLSGSHRSDEAYTRIGSRCSLSEVERPESVLCLCASPKN